MSHYAHFAQSQFKHRNLAIAAYRVAVPSYFNEIDRLARRMSAILLATHDAIRNELSPQMVRRIAETTARWPKLPVARAGAVIDGEVDDSAATLDAAPPDAVDSLFDREIEKPFRA